MPSKKTLTKYVVSNADDVYVSRNRASIVIVKVRTKNRKTSLTKTYYPNTPHNRNIVRQVLGRI